MEKKRVIKKICLLGEGGVGKTSLIGRYVFDCFSDDYIVSFGTKVTKKVLELDNVQLTLMIWDVLGQRSQRSLHAAYYAGANGALFVCDTTSETTLNALPTWLDDFKASVGQRPSIPLINKSDLPSVFGPDVIEGLGRTFGHECIFTSAKTGKGVSDAFERIGRRLLEVNA